ncbi:MAG: ABC transporter permease, partial [Bacteroidota bacterium]
IEGDLLERFEKNPSKWRFTLEVLKLLRPSLIKPIKDNKLNNYGMLKHNIKIAVRNFKRYKASFFVNLSGLVAGLVAALFIYLWVAHELRVDKFHENDDHIYRLVSDNGGNATLLNTSSRFANQLMEEIPEIESVVNSSWAQLRSSLILDEKVYSSTGEFMTEAFFDVFTYPLINGRPQNVLEKPNAIVLSKSMALKIFNSTDVVGKELEWRWFQNAENVEVTGVYEDPSNTSSAQFDYVLSFQIFENIYRERIERGSRSSRSFVQLSEGADVHFVNQKIADYTKITFPEYTGRPYFLIGYSDYYLNGLYENGRSAGGRIELVRLFIIIGMLILVIACANFMNLSTARAALRTKEIGVRKVMGAQRKSLIHQYLTESCLLSLFAGLFAAALVFLLFPSFKQLTGQALEIKVEIQLIVAFLGIIFLTGFFSGSYPALYLSSFKPLNVLKGQLTASAKDQWFRKGLVVFQFGVSLILIISVIVVYKQMDFIQSKSLGYNKEHILNFDTNNMDREKQQAFLSEVRKLKGVNKASGIIFTLFGGQISSGNVSWQGKDPEQSVWFEWGYIDYDMLELLEVNPVQGRFFS